jgi:hypothetical protein
MSRHSKAPLIRKLGIGESMRMVLVNPPPAFRTELGTLPRGARIFQRPRGGFDFILLFVKSRASLTRRIPRLARKLEPAGMLWVAWPKRTSKVDTDLSEEVVRKAGLAAGLVDTKVCALNEMWSALRFVVRLKDRTGWPLG